MIPLHPSQLFCCLIPQKRTWPHILTHPWGELTEWLNTFHNFSALQQICHLISHLPHDGIKTVQWKCLSLLLNNVFHEKHISRVLQTDGKHARMHQTEAGTRFRHKDYFPLIPAVTTGVSPDFDIQDGFSWPNCMNSAAGTHITPDPSLSPPAHHHLCPHHQSMPEIITENKSNKQKCRPLHLITGIRIVEECVPSTHILASLSRSILWLYNLTVFNHISRIVCTTGRGYHLREEEIYIIESFSILSADN